MNHFLLQLQRFTRHALYNNGNWQTGIEPHFAIPSTTKADLELLPGQAIGKFGVNLF